MKSNTEYDLVISTYKRYINLLNIPISVNGDYEWTEPTAGPIQVLLKLESIKSINALSPRKACKQKG